MSIQDILKKMGINTQIEPQPKQGLVISLWILQPQTDKSPILKGYVVLNGTRYPVVLWNNTSENLRAPNFVGGVNKHSTIGIVQTQA